MFINCPFCKALVATDPATDMPPDHCPRCAAKLRGVHADAAAPAVSTAARAEGQALADPMFLLEVPTQPLPSADAETGTPPSELSARIHQIVLEAPGAALDTASAIAPIATMLKHADEQPMPPAMADDGGAGSAGAAASEALPPSIGSAPAPATLTPSAAPTPTNPELATTREPVVAPPENAIDSAPHGTRAGDTAPSAATVPAAPAGTAPAVLEGSGIATTARRLPHASMPEAATPAAEAAPPAGQPALGEVHVAAAPTARTLPSFAQRYARPGAPGLHWKSLAAISALALLLVLQLLVADRAQLAADARWRPLVSQVCGVFGCSLPPWREPTAFTVLAREVRPHPSLAGVLRVRATFRNDARWAQPWPTLRLTLSDIDGNPVAARDFSARDYLGAAPAQAELRSGQSASITMDIAEPEPRSVAFDFELH